MALTSDRSACPLTRTGNYNLPVSATRATPGQSPPIEHCPACGARLKLRLGALSCPQCDYQAPVAEAEAALPPALAPGQPQQAAKLPHFTAGISDTSQAPAPALDLRPEKYVLCAVFLARAAFTMYAAAHYRYPHVSGLLVGHDKARLMFEVVCLGLLVLAFFGTSALLKRCTYVFTALCGLELAFLTFTQYVLVNPFQRWLEPVGADHTPERYGLIAAGMLQAAVLIWAASILYREGYAPRRRW